MEEQKKNIFKRLGAAWIVFLITLVLSLLFFLVFSLLVALVFFLAFFLPVLLYILIYKWIKRWFAALVFGFSLWLNLMVILIPVTGFIIFLDVKDFADTFETSPKYLILQDKVPIVGVKFDSLDNVDPSKLQSLNRQELSQVQAEINSEVKNKIIITVDKEVFRDITTVQVKELGGITFTKDELMQLLNSGNLPQTLSNLGINQPIEKVKVMTLLVLLQKTVETKGAEYLVNELKEGNIKIYPEKASVNLLIQIIPSDLINNVLPKELTSNKNMK